MTEIISRPPPPVARKPFNLARLTGIVLLGFWGLVGLAAIMTIVDGFEAEFFWKYAPRIGMGILTTVELITISITLGFLVALPVTFGRMSQNILTSSVSYLYVNFFRGTPLLAQVYLIYYGAGEFRPFFQDIGLWWFFREAYFCALLSFTLNTAAYQAEIFKGAIQSVPRGMREAGEALGLKPSVIFRKIIAPNAAIIALRPFGNEIILMIKGSAIASVITVFDLMGHIRRAYSQSYDFQVYIWAAILYLVLVEVLRRVWDRLEEHLTRHLKRSSD